MKAYTKECHTWLIDNNAYIYGDVAEYKGHYFTIDRAGSKFFCIDANGKHYKSAPVKVVAVRWACEAFDKAALNAPAKDVITIAQFANKAHTMWMNYEGSASAFAQYHSISHKAALLILDLGQLVNDDEFLNDDCK